MMHLSVSQDETKAAADGDQVVKGRCERGLTPDEVVNIHQDADAGTHQCPATKGQGDIDVHLPIRHYAEEDERIQAELVVGVCHPELEPFGPTQRGSPLRRGGRSVGSRGIPTLGYPCSQSAREGMRGPR